MIEQAQMIEPAGARAIAEINDYDTLIEALRVRKAELGLTDKLVDLLAGLADGHTGKILGGCHVKTLGPISMGNLLRTFAVKLIMVEDVKSAELMAPLWEERIRPAPASASKLARIGETTKRRVFPIIAREIAVRGGKARMANMTPKQLRRHQQRAARARHAKNRPPRRQA